jgi:YbgC/YbaW family acyl-CoA thioester hydrolase
MDPNARTSYRHFERLRVRWAEVDMQRIVFNGHYLMYFDTAIAGYWRSLAMPYHETMEAVAGDMVVRKATLEYSAPARFDEPIEVGVRAGPTGRTSVRMQCAVFRGAQAIVQGELVYVFVDPAELGPKPIPSLLRDWFEAFEAGAPMLEIGVSGWAAVADEAAALRQAVFTDELGIAADLDADGRDDTALHALARNRAGLAVATARLLPADGRGTMRLGRMAVLAGLRQAGVGRTVVAALVAAARGQGARRIELHAQAGAVAFWHRAGFVEEGPRFEEAGLPHQAMALAL